jgi:hypothetical protein
MAKLYIGNNEAQKTGREKSIEDKDKARKFKSHDIRDKYGLSFNDGKLLIFFKSQSDMLKKRKRLEMMHGEANIIEPKITRK